MRPNREGGTELTRVYLIRHAEAEGNIYRRAHGHVNGQIIGRGFRQIEQLRDRFLNEKIDAVYSSDLTRAKTTAAAICGPHGLPLNTTEKLREVMMGAWEDIAWGNMEYREPLLGRYFTTDPARWRVEGSETLEQVQNRMFNSISEIAKRHDGETIAVFSHGFSIRALMCAIMGIPSHESMKVPYCDNTAVALLLYDDGKLTVEYQGDNSHLDSETSTFAKQTWWRGDKELTRENIRIEKFDGQRDAGLADCADTPASAKSKIENGKPEDGSVVYTAIYADEPIGLIRLDTEKDKDRNIGWIRHICMKAEFCRKGFGVQLLGQAVSDFRGIGIETIRVEAPADSMIDGFCKKYGFAVAADNGDGRRIIEKNIRNW